MCQGNNTARSHAFRILILVVYGVFFMVHFFYVATVKSAYPHTPVKGGTTIQVRLKDDKTISVRKPVIKLNKRFHQESIEPVGYVFLERYSVPDNNMVVARVHDYLLISLILSQGLRGPPVVVV